MRKTLIIPVLALLILLPLGSAILPVISEKSNDVSDSGANLYPQLEVKDWLGLVQSASMKLEKHTAFCYNNCSSEFNIKTTKSSALIQDIRFDSLYGKDRVSENNLRYKLYIQTGEDVKSVPDYQNICYDINNVNGTIGKECKAQKIGMKDERIPIWGEYYLNQIMPPGEYNIRIEREKSPYENIDWVIKTQDKWINEWAVWSGYTNNNDKIFYYRFKNWNSSTVAADSVGKYNATYSGTYTSHAVGGITGFTNYTNSTSSTTTGNTTFTPTELQLDEFSLEWRTKASSHAYEIGSTSGGTAVKGFAIKSNTNKPSGLVSNGAIFLLNDFDFGCPNWDDNQWHHIVLVKNSSHNWKMYFDGTVCPNNEIGDIAGASATSIVLQNRYTKDAGTQGGIDQVIWWNRTLSAAEILEANNSENDGTVSASSIAVTLNHPSNGASFINTSIIFNATITPTNVNITNATIRVVYSNLSLFNQTTIGVVGNNTNNSIFNISSIPFGTFNWSVQSCGTNATLDSICDTSSNFTFTRNQFTEDSLSYETDVHETNNATFIINATFVPDVNFFSASLNYNGTNYLATATSLGGGSFNIKRTIDIPAVDTNTTKNFKWILTFDEGMGFSSSNSTSRQQNVSKTNISATVGAISVNYTLLDEETLTTVSSQFREKFDWYLGGGTTTQNDSYDLVKASSFKFYIIPSNYTLKVDSSIELSNATGSGIFENRSYYDRIFDFNLENFTNSPTERILYLMPSTNGTRIIVEVKDSGLKAMEDLYVTIKRFYPGTDTYKVVENRRTNIYGQFAVRLIEDNVKYQFEFRDSNNTLLKSTNDLTVSCRTNPCLLPFVIEDASDEFERYETIKGLSYTLNFTDSSNQYSLIWNDISSSSRQKRLEVIKYGFNGTLVVCNTTSSNAIGSMTCAVGSGKASYTASTYILIGGKETRFDTFSKKVGDYSTIFGLEGLMWAGILLLVMLSFGSFSPVLGVTLYIVGFITLGIMGIILINPAIFIATLVIGILFLWAIRS